MREVIAKDGERLEQIIYAQCGSLENFEKILEMNSLLPAILKAGDIVLVVDIEKQVPEVEEVSLW